MIYQHALISQQIINNFWLKNSYIDSYQHCPKWNPLEDQRGTRHIQQVFATSPQAAGILSETMADLINIE